MAAAAQHGKEALLLQSTVTSANVVFINIDWKATRHNSKRLKANMSKLGETIGGVVRNMKPAMICMCEVGSVSSPLTVECMQEVAEGTEQAWRDAATEHVELRTMFEVGEPYMTVYDACQIQCSCHRILHGLYFARGQPRTAQAWQCCGPGGVTVDMTNVHAPSGIVKLTDQQRRTLISNLLQSNSMSVPGCTIGKARFLIGGDMNTGPCVLSGILQSCRESRVLHTQEQVIQPKFGMHGDVCFQGGLYATCLDTTAKNHDPQHVPYGICWTTRELYDSGYATEQSLPPLPARSKAKVKSTTQHVVSSSQPRQASDKDWIKPQTTASASATEKWQHHCQQHSLLAAPVPAPPAPTPMPLPPQPTRPPPVLAPAAIACNPLPPQTSYATVSPSSVVAELEDLQNKVEQGAICPDDEMKELGGMHAKYGNALKPEDFEGVPDEETVVAATERSEETTRPQAEYGNVLKPEDFEGVPDEETVVAATERSEETTRPQAELDTQELPAGQTMVYSIVNEFLGQMTFNNPKSEQLLLAALRDETCLSPSMQQRIEEVFSPIFFHYPNGLLDRSVWEPRDTGKYIRQWRELAAWRARIETDVGAESTAAAEHDKQLSKDEVTQIWKLYLDDFKTSLRPEQLGRKWTYYKNCAESALRRETGSKHVAYAIWEIGLPRLPPFATEQRGEQLSERELEAVPEAIHNVLNWLDVLAQALSHHKSTSEYQTALRKSGVTHGVSGLTATELQAKQLVRRARFDMRIAKDLADRWQKGELTDDNCKKWQRAFLDDYWNGTLRQRHLAAVTSRGHADPGCRTPSVRPC
jgi:hypothetical protein